MSACGGCERRPRPGGAVQPLSRQCQGDDRRVIESWSEGTAAAAEGRHVLAIQDTSEINFATTAERRRGLGEIGKGNGRGVLLHAMLAVDAETGSCLGLLSGQVWTRGGRRTVSHDLRIVGQGIAALDRHRAGGQAAAGQGRDGDRARRPRERHLRPLCQRGRAALHVIARSMHDRKLADGTGCMRPAKPWRSWTSAPSCCLRGHSGPNGPRLSNCASAR